MAKPVKQYWWVNVGGNACEPAVYVDGQVFTFGCADPLTTEQAVLVKEMEEAPDTPEVVKKKKIAADAYWERERKAGRIHGYRRF